MPNLMDTDMLTGDIPGLGSFQYSAIRPDRLGADHYTLVTVAVDCSPSVTDFRDLLVDTVKKAVGACKKSPHAANILFRVITFSTTVQEVHGFRPLTAIDVDKDYDRIRVNGGGTALFDACASAIGAMNDYGRTLTDQAFGVGGILFAITDGEDNASTYKAVTVKEKVAEILSAETMSSFRSVLLGVNAIRCSAYLSAFQKEASLTEYRDAGDATERNMAAMADFVSKSVSSQANPTTATSSASIVI